MKPYCTKQDDGSMLFEWVAPEARFCINIEVDPSESGWCFVTKDGTQNCSGYLPAEFLSLLTALPFSEPLPSALDEGERRWIEGIE